MIEYISQLLHFISHDVETYEGGISNTSNNSD